MSVLKGKKILVADDEPMLREIIREWLEFEGASVREASNGSEAFQLIQADPVEAVISDIRMPGGDGFELLERLRTKDFKTPIVLLITGFSDLSHEAAYAKGADAVLSKPFDVNELSDRLVHLLLPLEERLSGPPLEPAKHHFPDDLKGTVKLGRGGFFAEGVNSYAPGTVISFQVQPQGMSEMISGEGVIRWVRKGDALDLPAGTGVEFSYLDSKSRAAFIEYLKQNPTRSFIPEKQT